MQISKSALMKLLFFLLATTPDLVAGGVVPQSANPPPCKDIAWDEHKNGLQTRICTESHPSMKTYGAQSMIAKRSNDNTVDKFESTFSSLMPNTEADRNNCAGVPTNTTTSTLDKVPEQDQSSNGSNNTTITRRDICTSRTLPYRSQLVDIPETSSKSWCFRPGPTPNNNDITSLCRNIDQLKYFGARESTKLPFHDDYVVQRAKASPSSITTAGMTRDNTTVAVEASGSCVCVAGRERTAGFKVCNCDRCDALVINRGLADMCKTLQTQCTSQGFSSGYIKSSVGSSLSNSIISLFTYPDAKGPKSEPMELDPILGEDGVLESSCRSGDEERRGQDYTGPVIECWDWVVGRFKGGRWCRDVVRGGERVWVKEKEDPMEKLRGRKKGEFSQFGDK
ncbi:hypothetical protein ONS95_003585 [Cadophora gregata]|uniref:uncharacterized protein n=1 Tax=Cadophora gregata TaxID=51156 RepID=UPI0026DABBF9|nr:uncharacterized protein ONS95_003585 [Cadophora gregata]KAK0106863.1 hypothetical protein ONS95_003585 [Cadophora gregata]KAK0116550.1 hypothetical protein ONS96_012408 [Cadophora gregata f. sp. sojae]